MIYNDDYSHFTGLVYRIFYTVRSMVCKTNKYSELHLDLIPYNPPYAYCYGFSNDTNIVTIFLGNIIQAYDHLEDELKRYFAYRRDDYIGSVILYSVTHELFHIDQIRYDDPFHIFADDGRGPQGYQIEGSVELKTDDFEINNSNIIESEFGFTYIYSDIKSVFETTPFIYEYRRLPNIEAVYKQLLNPSIFVNDFGLHFIDVLDYYGAENNIVINIIDLNGISRIIHVKVNGQFTEYGIYELVNALDYIDRYNLNGDKEFLNTEFGVEIRITLFPGNYYPLITPDE